MYKEQERNRETDSTKEGESNRVFCSLHILNAYYCIWNEKHLVGAQ